MITQANRLTTERDFLAAVVELAQAKGWRCAHFRPAMMSRVDKSGKPVWVTAVQADGAGFPDLMMLRTHPHGGRLIVVELKSERGKCSEAQKMWLEQFVILAKFSGADVRIEPYLWRPHDWDTLVKVLE